MSDASTRRGKNPVDDWTCPECGQLNWGLESPCDGCGFRVLVDGRLNDSLSRPGASGARAGGVKNVSPGCWIVIVPALPLLFALSIMIIFDLKAVGPVVWDDGTKLLLYMFLTPAPLFGVGTLAALLLKWFRGKDELSPPRVLAGVALSLLDIIIPVALFISISKDRRFWW